MTVFETPHNLLGGDYALSCLPQETILFLHSRDQITVVTDLWPPLLSSPICRLDSHTRETEIGDNNSEYKAFKITVVNLNNELNLIVLSSNANYGLQIFPSL